MNINENVNNVNVTNVLSQIARLIESVSPVSNDANSSSNSRPSLSVSRTIESPSTSTASTTRQHGNSRVSESEFQQVNNRASTSSNVPQNSTPLPSGYTPRRGSSNGSSSSNSFGSTSRTSSRRKTSGFVGRLRTWNKDVVCLPHTREITVSIPRGKQRGALSERGLIGKIRIMSTWNDMQVREEVTSVFAGVFLLNAGQLLDYDYLCVMTGMKKLKRPSVSSSFSWNGQEVASLAGQGSLYIMANTTLPSTVTASTLNIEDEDEECELEEGVESSAEEPTRNASEEEEFPEMNTLVEEINNDDLQTLRAMFPHTSEGELEEALRSNLTIDFAIDELLSGFSQVNAVTSSSFDAAEYFGRQLSGEIFILSINRDNFWQEAFMFYKRGADVNRPFRVAFGRDDMEIGIDTGGPRREFFQLLADKMTSTIVGFFEGDMPNLLPTMKGPALRLGHFRILGTIIAHSIINGGIGFPYLARPVFEYIVTQNAETCLIHCTPEIIPNKDTRNIITEISSSTVESFGDVANRPDVLDYICNAGWTGIINFSEKEHLVATLLLHEIIWKRESAINQLIQGMKLVHVLETVQKFPDRFQSKFVYNIALTSSVFKEQLVFMESSDAVHERTKEFFLRYIDANVTIACGEDHKFKRCAAVLQFTTGQQFVGGLHKKIEVGYSADPAANYPCVGTCGLKFFLPIKQETFEEFSRDMDKALECEAYGFDCY